MRRSRWLSNVQDQSSAASMATCRGATSRRLLRRRRRGASSRARIWRADIVCRRGGELDRQRDPLQALQHLTQIIELVLRIESEVQCPGTGHQQLESLLDAQRSEEHDLLGRDPEGNA